MGIKASIRPFSSKKFLPLILDTHELAASAVNDLLKCEVYLDSQKRFQPVRLQLSFSIPGYHADVLAKSFQIFYEEVFKNMILNFISCFWGYRTKLEYDKLKVNGVHRDHPPA